MCYFPETSEHVKSFTGYKIVAKRGNRYFSIAMGFEYVNNADIPVVKRENERHLSGGFSSNLLTNHFVNEMQGRTSVFENLQECSGEYRHFNSFRKVRGYKLVIVKAKVLDAISGLYVSSKIWAGKRIVILEEIKSVRTKR